MSTQIKQCIKCRQIKDASAFYQEKRVHDGLGARCKDCMKTDAGQSYSKNKEKVLSRLKSDYDSRKSKDSDLKRKYGITIDDWEKMFEAQNRCCAICGTSNPNHGSGSFVVDHCHSSLQIRGLLCGICNAMLGQARDSTETLKAAIVYLEKEHDSRSIAERKENLGLTVNETTLLTEARRSDLDVIIEWRSSGVSLRTIAERLNSANIKPLARLDRWTSKSVRSVIDKRHSYLDSPTVASGKEDLA
jgi:hypothetical protein